MLLVVVPVLILIVAGLTVLTLHQLKVSIGYIWLVTLGSSIAAWLILFIVNWDKVPPIISEFWNLPGSIGFPIGFDLDKFSWPYAFSLSGLLVAVLLTAAVRFQFKSDPGNWASSLFMGGAGLLAVFATTPLSMVLAWTAVDIIELVILMVLEREKSLNQRTILAFVARFGGTFLVLLAMMSARKQGVVLAIESALPPQSVYLLVAAGLRLGVIPLHLSFTSEPIVRRGLGTVLRLVPPAASLVMLGRLPPAVVPPNAAVYVLLFCILAAGYGAVMWLFSKNDMEGRPYWMIALAGLAIAAAVRGQPEASPAWGVAMMIMGGLVFLFSDRRKPLVAIPLVGLVGLTGLPFTPVASGLPGLSVFPFNLPDVFFIVVHATLLAGTFRQLMRKEEVAGLERWMVAVYAFGLVILVLCHWMIGLFGFTIANMEGIWWAAVIAIILAIIIVAASWWWQRSGLTVFLRNDNRLALIRKTGRIFFNLFQFDWLYIFIGWLLRILQNLVNFLTRLLEGEGGVLWTLLLIILLASFLATGVQP